MDFDLLAIQKHDVRKYLVRACVRACMRACACVGEPCKQVVAEDSHIVQAQEENCIL